MDTPYRGKNQPTILAAGSFDEAVELILKQESAAIAARPTYGEVCINYHHHIEHPETVEEKVSSMISQNRLMLLQAIDTKFSHEHVISTQEFISRALQEALERSGITEENLKNERNRLFDQLMSYKEFVNQKLDEIDLSSDEGERKAIELLQKIIETLNNPDQLLRKAFGKDYLEVDDDRLAHDTLNTISTLVPWLVHEKDRKNDEPGIRLTDSQEQKVEYFILSLGTRIQLAAGHNDEDYHEYYDENLSAVLALEGFFNEERAARINELVHGFERSKNPYKYNFRGVIGFLSFLFIFSPHLAVAIGKGKIELPQFVVINLLTVLTLLYTFLIYASSRLRALRDQYPLEGIDPEAIKIYKILARLKNNIDKLYQFPRPQKEEIRKIVTEIKVLGEILSSMAAQTAENDESKSGISLRVGSTQIQLGSAALEASVSQWSINIGTTKKPQWVFGPQENATKKKRLPKSKEGRNEKSKELALEAAKAEAEAAREATAESEMNNQNKGIAA